MALNDTAPSMQIFMQFTSRLGSAMCWTAVLALHSLLLSLASLALWATQVSPQSAWGFATGIATSTLAAVLTLVFGGSVVGLWVLAMKRLSKAMHGWLWHHLSG